jgi:hypothetical protein
MVVLNEIQRGLLNHLGLWPMAAACSREVAMIQPKCGIAPRSGGLAANLFAHALALPAVNPLKARRPCDAAAADAVKLTVEAS